MSRLSRANLKARESIFAGASSENYRADIHAVCPPNLEECVLAMQDCCEEAYEAQILLRSGTQDLPRMTKVLSNERVFLLVNEDTIKRYKADLADEIEPSINELIERSEQGLAALLKKKSAMEAKVANAQSRPIRPVTGTSAAEKMEARKLQMVRKQRERMEAEVKALEEEVEALELKAMNERRERVGAPT